MQRLWTTIALTLVLVGLAAPAASAATGPKAVHGGFDNSGTIEDARLPCSEPVALSYEQRWSFTDVTLKDGRIREVGSWIEQDTFTANGKKLVSDWYTTHYTAIVSDVNWTSVYSEVWSGKIFSATLPDGTRLQVTGRVDVTGRELPIWTVDVGRNMDFDALCGYFFD
jgi:hypothetical protein